MFCCHQKRTQIFHPLLNFPSSRYLFSCVWKQCTVELLCSSWSMSEMCWNSCGGLEEKIISQSFYSDIWSVQRHGGGIRKGKRNKSKENIWKTTYNLLREQTFALTLKAQYSSLFKIKCNTCKNQNNNFLLIYRSYGVGQSLIVRYLQLDHQPIGIGIM